MADPASVFLQVMAREQLDVGLALAQARQLDRDAVEAMEEIRAEGPLVNGALQRHVGGADESRIEVRRLPDPAAERDEVLFLEQRQQLRLRRQRQRADLVQEQRSAIGKRHAAALLFSGSRERAVFVPEQLALGQLLGIVAQSIATNGACARFEMRCRASAITALPVPVSPRSRTGISVGPKLSTSRQTRRLAALWPDRFSSSSPQSLRCVATSIFANARTCASSCPTVTLAIACRAGRTPCMTMGRIARRMAG